MNLTIRHCHSEDDYWRIRQFLREVFLLNDRREVSWQTARMDYWRWHGIENMGDGTLEHDVFIWEDSDGRIVSVLNREAPGSVFLQVHPSLCTPEVEEEMIDIAQHELAAPDKEGNRRVRIWVGHDNTVRQELLQRHGFVRAGLPECQHRRVLDEPLPAVSVPAGYSIRPLGGDDEIPARSWASWRAFHPHASDDDYQGHDWYHVIQRMPLYRRDLDIVAMTALGEVAVFCTVWYDDVTRTGYFEPVGRVAGHEVHGLARGVILEAMRRLQLMGGTLMTVGGYTFAANVLYASVTSLECARLEPWVKEVE